MQHRVCYIHVGTHKTGTTSIQAFLGANEAQLAASGVLLPRSGRPDPAFGSHHNIAWELRGDDRYDPALGSSGDLVAELRSSGARAACLSSEDFELGWSAPHGFARLCTSIRAAGWTPRAIVYLRPQAVYCERVYAELLKHGYRRGFVQYVDEVLALATFDWYGTLANSFDYMVLLNFLERTTQSGEIVVRPYREAADRALLTEFARTLGVTDTSAYVFPERLNRTASFAEVLRMAGRGAGVDVPLALPFKPLTARQAARIARRFGPSNLALARRYGVVVPPVGLGELMQPLQRVVAPRRAGALAAAQTALARSA
jgi:hypothetical protein